MTPTPSRDEMLALADELLGWHDCADGDVDAGNGHFRLVTISDPDQQRRNLRATLRDAARLLRLAVSASDGVQPSIPDGGQPALEIIEQNCWDLRCVSLPTGAGDADIGWEIVEHHMAPPKERIIGRGNSPMEALNEALGAPENVSQPPESGER